MVFHDLFTYRWWWQFEGFEAREETQNAFSDLLGVVRPFLSLILENLVGLKSSCNKEPVIFSWGGSQGFWKERQSMKGILWKIDCQLIVNEGGEGGGGRGRVTRLLQSLLGEIRGTLL